MAYLAPFSQDLREVIERSLFPTHTHIHAHEREFKLIFYSQSCVSPFFEWVKAKFLTLKNSVSQTCNTKKKILSI